MKPSFQCTMCPQAFARKEHYNRHLLCVHYTENKRKCPYCNFKYVENYQISKHLKKFHNNKVKISPPSDDTSSTLIGRCHGRKKQKKLCCSICSKAYSKEMFLKKHLKAVHGDDCLAAEVRDDALEDTEASSKASNDADTQFNQEDDGMLNELDAALAADVQYEPLLHHLHQDDLRGHEPSDYELAHPFQYLLDVDELC